MKILLVDPFISATDEYGNLVKLANIIPNLGLGYIAASLEKHGFKVKILDCFVEGISTSDLVNVIKNERPEVVGFTATVLSINSALEAAQAIKNSAPEVFLIIGGPQVSALPQETMARSTFDVGVIGEGEITIIELLNARENGDNNYENINGIIFRKNGKLILSPKRPPTQNLSSLPHPAFHLLPPLSSYKYSPISTLKMPCAHLISSRGCPFSCKFCDKSVTGSKFRARDPEDVVEEIEKLIKNYKIREIKFFDDTFSFDNERVYEICDLMDKKKIDIPWSCIMHPGTVNKNLLNRIKSSGCWQVVFGLESGNQRILDTIGKPLTLEQSRTAVRLSHEVGLNVRATLIVGLPNETSKTINDTLNFTKEIELDTASFYIFSPYPGCDLFKELKENGEIIHTDYEYYQLVINPKKAKLPFVPQDMSEYELRYLANKCYKDFYLRPKYIMSQLKQIKNFYHLRRYWRCLGGLLEFYLYLAFHKRR